MPSMMACRHSNVAQSLYYYPSVSSRAATISSGGLVEERDTGPVHGEDCGDRQPAVGSDMVAMGFGDLLNQSVGAEDSELPAHRRRTPALFFQREREFEGLAHTAIAGGRGCGSH